MNPAHPLITIGIPTYNRCQFLRETIESLLPQLGTESEILICDNASTDGTSTYLASLSLGSVVTVHRHPSNLGADGNLVATLERARGRYIWLLGDDDLPRANLLAEVVRAVREFNEPPVVYLRAKPCDIQLSGGEVVPVDAGWVECGRDEFLQRIGVWVTFMSSALIRRDCLEMAFIRGYQGTSLTPCAAVLAAVGKGGRAVVSTTTMINARGGNSGGYNGVEVFSTNLKAMLVDCERFGYSGAATDHVLADSLATAVPDAIWNSPWRWSGLVQVTKSCAFQRPYATKVLPAYGGALVGATRRFLKGIAVDLPGRILLKLLRRQSASSYEAYLDTANELAYRYAKEQIRRLGPGSNFRHPVYLSQPQYLKIGQGFKAGPGVRLEAWDQYGEDRFTPEIEIGDNVIFSNNVHVGAINRVRIGNDVLVGSNVLITDYDHGRGALKERVQVPHDRRLHSKGPVIIGNQVYIGENASILSGVRVGQGAIIGANSVVTRDVPDFAVVGGAPARILRHESAP